MSEVDIRSLTDQIGEIAAHAKEARELAAKGMPKADVDERFDKMAQDAVEANEKMHSALSDLSERQDSIFTEMEKLRFTNPGDTTAEEAKEHRAYNEALTGYVRMGFESRIARDYLETRALNETVGPEGGYFVSDTLEAEIIKNATNMSPVWDIARTTVLNADTDRLTLRKRSSGVTAYWVGESSEPTKSNAKYAKIEIPADRCAVETVASIDLLNDVSYIENEMTIDAAEGIDSLMGTAFVSGSGAGQPEGLMTCSDVDSVTGDDASSDIVAWEDGYSLLYGTGATGKGLKAPYRANATFAFNSNTLASIMKLADSNGNPIWSVAPAEGAVSRVWGRPWITLEDMDDEADGAYPIICGDFYKGYRIVRKPGMYVLRDPYTAKPDVEILWRLRIGGKVRLAEAFKKLSI